MADLPTESELYKKILAFILDETRTQKRISLQSNMERDLGVTGDDAAELMSRFGDEFDVDMSNFKFDDYFGGEGFSLIALVSRLFVQRRPRRPLTIALLLEAADNKRWPIQT